MAGKRRLRGKSIPFDDIKAILTRLPLRYLIRFKIRSKQPKNVSDTAENRLQVQGKSIPVDVLEAILSRLPVKSLIRFQILSKSWKTIISDPWFSKINYNHSPKSQNLLLRGSIRKERPGFCLMRLEGGSVLQTEAELEAPFGTAFPLCCCNGIVLLITWHTPCHEFVLWNPSIRRYAMIPIPVKPGIHWINPGLYHDSRTDDYKVAIISEKHSTVYSCKTRTWSEEELIPCSKSYLYGVHVDGCFHWQKEPYLGEIWCYDFRERKTEKLKLPDDLGGKMAGQLGLTRLWGHLSLHIWDSEDQVWVRENDGWRDLSSLLKTGIPFCHTMHKAVSFSPFVINYNDPEMRPAIYSDKLLMEFKISGVPCYELLPYSESLFFPFEAERV